MKELMAIAFCIGVCWLVEYVYGLYLDTLPKDRKDELIKRQSQIHCKSCGATDFEVVGMAHGKVKFQCRNCKKIGKLNIKGDFYSLSFIIPKIKEEAKY